MDSQLLDIVKLARAGERDTALQHLRVYLGVHPDDADAWVILSGLAPDARIARSALRRALALDPNHALARQRLATLETQRRPLPKIAPEPSSGPSPPSAATVAKTTTTVSVDDAESTQSDELRVAQTASLLVDETTVLAEPSSTDSAFQLVREARALVWPFSPRGTKRRPLGELLDERQITRQDLLWASAEANSEDVRVASNVILESVHNLPDVAMSLEEARLISWPFRRLNRPLGELVNASTVRVKDLRRAAWFAKDARLREASRMLLPAATAKRAAYKNRRTKQKLARQTANATPIENAARDGNASRSRVDAHTSRPMTIIQGSRYLADEVQQHNRRQVAIAAAAVVLLSVVLGVFVTCVVRGLVEQEMPSVWLLPVMVILMLALYRLWNRFAELRHEGRNFRRGQLGETRVAQQLRHGLGGDWTLFRNVQLPGTTVDIDMVLLGSSGVYALEVKAYTGNYRFRKQVFYRHTRVGWRKMQHNPGKQARAGAGLLHNYIVETLNRDLWVEPRLVWVGPGRLQLRNPEVYVWYFDNLDQETERLRGQSPRLSTEDQAALSGLLRGLCSTLR